MLHLIDAEASNGLAGNDELTDRETMSEIIFTI